MELLRQKTVASGGVVYAIAWVWCVAGALSAVDPGGTCAAPSDGSGAVATLRNETPVVNLLEPIRQKYAVPAICAAVVNSERIIAGGAVGVRKRGTDIPVTVNDIWHLGSETKAMTAALIGRLVERGQLRWDSTMAEIFPEWADEMQPEMKDVTILHLLSHWAGLVENVQWHQFAQHGCLSQQRYAVAKKLLTEQPEYPPGTGGHYSNAGYVLAGAVVEKITADTWENQIAALLFEPLGMASAGFGGVGTAGCIDQPWGHYEDGRPVERNGPAMDNPPVLGPAGRVHCTISDWAAFVIDQLRGAQGKAALLEPKTYQRLHQPPFGDVYALGWLAVPRNWADGTALTHSGSNTMNYATVWIAPNRDFAALVCINQGGQVAFKASDEAVGALIEAFLNTRLENEELKMEEEGRIEESRKSKENEEY